MAFLYPWGNTQQLNLDWILQKIKELETGGGAGADLEEVANALIAITHRSTTQYRRWDYCFYNGKLYRALVDTTGAFAPGDWREVVLGDDVSVLTRLINALNTDNIDNASNVTGNTASDALNNLLTALGNLDSDDIDNASQVTGAAVTDALNTLNGAINHNVFAVAGTLLSSKFTAQNIFSQTASDSRITASTNVAYVIFDDESKVTSRNFTVTPSANNGGTVTITGTTASFSGTINVIIGLYN